jgi:long-chain acyl-CoA synthetase
VLRCGGELRISLLTQVQECLQRSAALQPDKIALVCRSGRFTYGWLELAANRLANALHELGVARGDRVAIYLNNSVELVVGIFAVLKAGGVFIVVTRATKTDKLLYVLSNSRSTVLIADDRTLDSGFSGRISDEVPGLKVVVCSTTGVHGRLEAEHVWEFNEIQVRFSSSPPPCCTIDLDLACLIYTSGTTGKPKGVMCDHSSVVFVAQTIVRYLKNVADDVILNVLPLASSYGLYQLIAAFLAGSTLVLEQSFAFPIDILQIMARERVTGFAGVPTIFSILLGIDLQSFDLSSLRYLTNAAAGLPVEHVKRLLQIFPNTEIFLMHGLTEVGRTMYLPPDQTGIHPDSSGIALPGTELWIEDESGHRLGPGQVGELVVRGRHVMRGYWDDPAQTAERFRPGPIPGERLCYSGDLFRTDEEGFFYFVSRKDDMIKCRGEKVAPREVENVLYSIPGVQDAAVIGVPDTTLGQAVKAFIVAPGAMLTAAHVLAYCRTRLEDVCIPQYVEFRSELPKTDNGKIRKRDLS